MLKATSATFGSILLAASAAHAAETTTYTYDPLGRLTQLQMSGGPSNGITRAYTYDATDNRTSFQLSGAVTGGSVTITPLGAVANETSIGVTLGVTITGNSPSGWVTFAEGGTFLGAAFISNGQASVILEGLALGNHTVTATYAGDGTNAPFAQTFTVKVQNLSWLPAVLEIVLSN